MIDGWKYENILRSKWKIFFPEKRIFISKEHNWAFAAWEMARFRGWIQSNATLVHVDSHHDDCIDGIQVTGLNDIHSEDDAFAISFYDYNPDSNRIPVRIDNFIFA